MAKGRLLEDTFEQLVELGQSSAKKTAKQVAKTFNPFIDAPETQLPQSPKSPENNVKSPNHTPLNFDRLKNKYQDNEKTTTQALRNRLFQMVKQGDEKLIMDNRQRKLAEKRNEESEEQEKKRRLDVKKRSQAEPIPMGRIRKSIFSPKKAAQQQHTEIRPASGKQ